MFDQRGLGAEAASWIGTGRHRPLTPEPVTGALGEQRVESLASRMGLGKVAGAAAIAALLPALIDKLTPDGSAPQTSSLGGLLGGLLGGGAARAEAAPARPRADFSNVQSGSSTTPSPPPEQSYTVASGDSLSKIAKRFYGDANQWRRIYDANRDQVENPDLIHPGQKLKIPTVPKSV
jgi:LysM repeat protein